MKGFNLFKFLYRTHIYGGLFIAPFLLIMAVSAFQMHHHAIDNEPRKTEERNLTIQPDTLISNDSLSAFLVQSTGIYGYIPFWLKRSDSTWQYHFEVMRPGRQYEFDVNRLSGDVQMKEHFMGMFPVFVGMHEGLSGNPKSSVFSIWHIFGEVVFIVFAIVLMISIYFWFRKSIHSLYEGICAVGSIVLITLFILYLWLIG